MTDEQSGGRSEGGRAIVCLLGRALGRAAGLSGGCAVERAAGRSALFSLRDFCASSFVLCSTSLPGGNQVDGLPPAFHVLIVVSNFVAFNLSFVL